MPLLSDRVLSVLKVLHVKIAHKQLTRMFEPQCVNPLPKLMMERETVFSCINSKRCDISSRVGSLRFTVIRD